MNKSIAPRVPTGTLKALIRALANTRDFSVEEITNVLKDERLRRRVEAYIRAGCPNITGLPKPLPKSGYVRAKAILGKKFIPPEEVAFARSLTYDDDTLRNFYKTIPCEEVLQWLHENDFILIAGPPEAMSLLDIQSLNTKLFNSELKLWYAQTDHNFSRDEKVTPEWLMLRRGSVPKSKSKKYKAQCLLLSNEEVVPYAVQVAWVATTYYEVRGKWILSDFYVRTASMDAAGIRIVVGLTTNDGIVVNDYCDDDHCNALGITSARKSGVNS